MKNLKFLLFVFSTLSIISNAQTIIQPGDVSGTWTLGGSPYEIQGDITIPDGLTLTIEPEVLIEFQGHYKLNVQGRLLAVGAETDTITFTINDTTGFHDPSIPDGGWHGIRFDSTSAVNDSSKIIYSKLQYGKAMGPFLDNSGGAIYVTDFDKLLISNCLITNNSADAGSGGGIFLYLSSPRIEAITISNNTALWGGGIGCLNNSSPIFRNNTISGNYASNYGGGISCTYTTSMVVENNIITENEAHEAAGIRLDECSSITITLNVITSNNAIDDDGGGIFLRDCNDITIEGNTISNNSAEEGGGIWQDDCEATFANNTISDNSAENDGGGIFCKRSSNLTLIENTISSNQADNSGGGIYVQLSNLQVDNCVFEDNEASDGSGGAIYFVADTIYNGVPFLLELETSQFINNTASNTAAGIRVTHWGEETITSNVIIDNCNFIENSADYNTGLNISGSSFSLSNSTFKDNTAVRYGGGFGVDRSVGKVWNCLFASNTASTGGGDWNSGGVSVWRLAIMNFMNCTFADNSASYGAGLTVGPEAITTTTNCIFWGNSNNQIALATYNNEGGTLFVNYCDIEGGEDSVNVIDSLSTLNWENGNLDEDPIFEDSGNGNFHLQNSSPCIGSAIDSMEINGSMCYCPLFDIEGNPRPNPNGSMPDMGAYESEYPVGVDDDILTQPTDYVLYQNYPNPFNPSTKIKYQIPELSFVTFKIYDVLGSEVATLINEEKSIGSYEVEFNISSLRGSVSAKGGYASGVYFYQLKAGDYVETKKMLLLK